MEFISLVLVTRFYKRDYKSLIAQNTNNITYPIQLLNLENIRFDHRAFFSIVFLLLDYLRDKVKKGIPQAKIFFIIRGTREKWVWPNPKQ